MFKKQSKPRSKNSAVSSIEASSKKYRIHNRTCCKPVTKKTSVEDLAEKGYTIGRVLGEGSYCKVKAARFQSKDMAVKIITRSQLSLDFENKFLPRELNILASIRHPNIVHVYKIFRYPRRIYIFMELIDRGDLLQYIMNRGRLMESEARHYFKQMLSAIRYLHSLNIAHRDLKCENMMITDTDEIKIIDFGFCRYAVNEKNRRVLSHTYCGSTAYAAPEILLGIPYNPMMYDIWSLGCVLYIMLTGTMPFDDSNVPKMISCQLKRQFVYPRTVNIAKTVKSLISQMLEPDVILRANVNQVSQCLWLKQGAVDFLPKSSIEKDYLPSSMSNGTQEDLAVCICGELHVLGECMVCTSSDESD